jgi:hypothetical protein
VSDDVTDSVDPSELDALQELLATALDAVEPLPEHVLEGARAAFSWRTIDAELAELAFDSATSSAGVRSGGTERELTFRSAELEIELLVAGTDELRLMGQLVPPGEATVELRTQSGTQEAVSDRLGQFRFEAAVEGPAQLVVRRAGSAETIHTDWVVL